jgi:hypothetical protein
VPSSGNGDAPLRSAWFWRGDGVAGAALLHRVVQFGTADQAGRDAWVDWFFGAAVVVADHQPAAELALDLFGFGDDDADVPTAFAASDDAPAAPADPLLFLDPDLDLVDADDPFAALADIAFAGVGEDEPAALAGGDDWLSRFRRRMRR